VGDQTGAEEKKEEKSRVWGKELREESSKGKGENVNRSKDQGIRQREREEWCNRMGWNLGSEGESGTSRRCRGGEKQERVAMEAEKKEANERCSSMA